MVIIWPIRPIQETTVLAQGLGDKQPFMKLVIAWKIVLCKSWSLKYKRPRFIYKCEITFNTFLTGICVLWCRLFNIHISMNIYIHCIVGLIYMWIQKIRWHRVTRPTKLYLFIHFDHQHSYLGRSRTSPIIINDFTRWPIEPTLIEPHAPCKGHDHEHTHTISWTTSSIYKWQTMSLATRRDHVPLILTVMCVTTHDEQRPPPELSASMNTKPMNTIRIFMTILDMPH